MFTNSNYYLPCFYYHETEKNGFFRRPRTVQPIVLDSESDDDSAIHSAVLESESEDDNSPNDR